MYEGINACVRVAMCVQMYVCMDVYKYVWGSVKLSMRVPVRRRIKSWKSYNAAHKYLKYQDQQQQVK